MVFTYEDISDKDRMKFCMPEDCVGIFFAYIHLISWMRTRCCHDGLVFEEIRSLDDSIGRPFLEIEVVVLKPGASTCSSKLLYRKRDLYLVAFTGGGKWFQFNIKGLEITIGQLLTMYSGSYNDIDAPWNKLGPGHMLDAAFTLSKVSLSEWEYVSASMVFVVCMSEGTRFRFVEYLVAKSLHPKAEFEFPFDVRPFEDEQNHTFKNENGEDIEDDKYSLYAKAEAIDLKAKLLVENEIPTYLNKLIHSYDALSAIWCVYSLSGKKKVVFEDEVVCKLMGELNIPNIKSLRYILGVLCKPKLEELERIFQKQLGENLITKEEHKEIKARIDKIKGQKGGIRAK